MKQQQFFPDTKLLPTFYNKSVGAWWAIANPDLVGPKGIEYCIIVGRIFPFYCLPTRYLFVCNRGDTVQYHGGLRSRELGNDVVCDENLNHQIYHKKYSQTWQ